MSLCLPLQCDSLQGVNHGTIQCTNDNRVGSDSECSFECDVSANFTLYPANAPPVTCLRDERGTYQVLAAAIMLSDYPNDKAEFFHAFENTFYGGIGTNTGRALARLHHRRALKRRQ